MRDSRTPLSRRRKEIEIEVVDRAGFIVRYVVFVVVQLLLSNYVNFTPYLGLSILPAMILCIPTRVDTLWALVVAFVTGVVVDLLVTGVPGLTIAALVPVGLVRRWVCDAVFGEELKARGDDFSSRKYGTVKVIFVILLVQTLFWLVFVIVDGGPARPPMFSVMRFFASMLASVVVSFPVVEILTPDDRK